MSKEKITKENLYIYYNSLVSISSISETNINRYSKYLIRIENLEQTLLFKKCLVPLYDFSDLKESLFYIREYGDEDEDEDDNEENDDDSKDNNENKRLNFSQKFILQHMLSKTYISLEILPGNNNYNLKLTSNKDTAVPFILKRIHETRDSQEFLTFKESFYLSIYIKEKEQYYYINSNSYVEKPPEYEIDSLLNTQNNLYVSNENIITNKKNQININNNNIEEDDSDNGYKYFYENFSELCIEKRMNCKYTFLNQSWYEKYEDKLFSSQIINIIFINSNSYKDTNINNVLTEKEEQLMLSAEYIDNINDNVNADEVYDINQQPIDATQLIKKKKHEDYFYDENKGLISLMTNKKKLRNQIRVKLVPYETDFYKHVLNNSFWVIEEELTDYKEKLEKSFLKEKTQIKIKNVLLGLYLKVKKKGNDIEIEEAAKEDDKNSNRIDNNNSVNEEEEEAEYEFELVDEETLIKNNFFFSNFRIFHYNINEKNEYMSYKGKFALRNNFKDDQKEIDEFDFEEINKYFQPLSINLDSEKKYYILQKNEDEYIFEIKKVDIYEANHVIYINKIIKNFNFYLEKCIRKEIRINNAIKVIFSYISFFINYIINVEYIFSDENYDSNEPIMQRQIILENYGILKSIRKIAEYLLPIVNEMNSKIKNIYQLRKSQINNESLTTNRYRLDTLNEQMNTNNINVVNMKKLIKIILDFLTHLSNNNEEIKEKIFLDLGIILELAENVFVSDKSFLLDFIIKLIKHSEALQEYITGGKLNLLFTIKNSKNYSKYAEKESQNQLIKMDKILEYIETSYNYLYYYKKLLKLDKVKHKKEQIKQLILEHMKKVDNEYKTRNKYNYKKIFFNIINRAKMILKRIEKPLLKTAENMDKLAEKEINNNRRKTEFNKQKNNNDDISKLDNILENNDLKNNLKKKDKEDDKNEKLNNIPENIDDSINSDEDDSASLMNNYSQKDERISQKSKIEESLKNIKLFLFFFQNFNINNILFAQEKCNKETFCFFNNVKNLKKNLDFVVGEDDEFFSFIDGFDLDINAELGQMIPFKIFNTFFPAFLKKDKININKEINIINDNIDEDSENDLYNENNDNDIIEEKNENEEEEININKYQDNQQNKIKKKNNFIFDRIKTKELDIGKVFSLQANQNMFFNKKFQLNKNNSSTLRRSGTNPQSINNRIINNFDIDDSLLVEIEQKKIDEDLNKLNKYLCILYTIYQFCINEYYEYLLDLLTILNNYIINYEGFCNIDILKNNLTQTRENLISIISFINNDVLINLFSAARNKPTLLKGVFDFNNFLFTRSKNDTNKLNKDDIDDLILSNDKYEKTNTNKIKSKNRENKKLKEVLIPEEVTLIKSLFSFCKKFDKISFMIDKITYFRKIREIINNNPDEQNSSNFRSIDTLKINELDSLLNDKNDLNNMLNNNKDNEENYIQKFRDIIKEFKKKRNQILSAYIDINKYKKYFSSFSKNHKNKNQLIENLINKRIKIIIKLAMKYELDNFFGKLIYLDNYEEIIYCQDNTFENLKSVQNKFISIRNLLKQIKIDYDRRGDNCIKIVKDENNIITQLSFNESDFNKEHFKTVNKYLSELKYNFLNFLCKNPNGISKFKNMPILNQILYKENDYFYKKIGFEKIMQSLIETMDYYYDFNRYPFIKLNYCQEILRLFLEIQNIYKNFKETIPSYFELYYKMMMNSLYTISLYQANLTGKFEEKYFLKICYYCCESFMIVIFNSRKTFDELRSFMIDILSKLLKIYSHLINPKNRIIFQILYTYYISRVLLFISKEKYFDDFSYNSFFQIVYPQEQMHEQIISCMKELEKNEEELDDDSSEEKEDSEESKIKNEFKNDGSKKVTISIINTNTNQKNIINDITNNKNKSNIMYPEETIQANQNDNETIWENDEEKEKFCFYLNFLSIYLLYLHDRNSMKKIRDNTSNKVALNSIEYNYKNLYTKIQKLLGNEIEQDKLKEFLQNNMNNLQTLKSTELSHRIEIDIRDSTLNNQNFVKNLKSRKNYQFESILVESIILYKYRLKNQTLEIPVKNRKFKGAEEEILSNNDNRDNTSTLSEKIEELRNREMITFYYYDNEFIDLILLEKICNDINLKENLNYYCIEENITNKFHITKDDLMKIVLNMKTECKLLMSYNKNEYKILHDQFIQNDMEQFIMLLKTRFTNKDFNNIYSMKKFLYQKMNEIYQDDLYLGEENLNAKKVYSFVELFKLIENLYYQKNPGYEKINLYSFLTSLRYLYPTYPKKTCVFFYRTAFDILNKNYSQTKENTNENISNNLRDYRQMTSKEKTISYSHTKAHRTEEKFSDLDQIIEGFILLFSRKINRNVLQEEDDFFLMINSLIKFLKELKSENLYLMERGPMITKLFTILDFIFVHLFNYFEKIINFMKSVENQKLKDKFRKKEKNLKVIIIFISTILSLQKSSENLLTQNIIEFIQNLTGQIIKLIQILIEIGKEDSMKTCDMLIDFIYFFIEGPNINNLNSLFSYGFFNLLSFVITKIDYYKIFLNNINRINLYDIMDNFAKIEQKIIRIFSLYYNVSYNNPSNIKECEKLREWYEKNYFDIKIKLKKLYHFSKEEMENRVFDIDKALIYKMKNDEYSEQEFFLRAGILNKTEIKEISFEEKLYSMLDEDNLTELQNNDINNNYDIENNNPDLYQNIENSENERKSNYFPKKNYYCFIKFDLILMYYSLCLYYKDIINEDYFQVENQTNSFLTNFINFFINFAYFIKDIILAIPELILYFYRRVKKRAKEKVDLLQELNKIDEDILSINEKDMFLDLNSKIKCVEITINHILYKVYFPLINKAKKIVEKSDYYLHVGNDDLPDYVSYLIRKYDKIHIDATKNLYFDKLKKIPILNIIFKNIDLIGIFLMLIGIVSNLLILLSYSDFNNDVSCDCGKKCEQDDKRLHCPRFLFNKNRKYETIIRALKVFGIIQLFFQSLVLLNHLFRNFSISYTSSKNNYIIKKAKRTHQKSNIQLKFCENLKIFFIAVFGIFSFQTLYYILYIVFIFLGLFKHPFFYGFSLLELCNRVDVMLLVLKAIYVPGLYLLVNLLMLIMLEYLFALFTLSFFNSHFPNIRDGKNFLQTYMRLFDQTFKQDGGIGTYLDQSLSPDYEPYTPKAYVGGRFWFDLIFYILIICVVFQISISVVLDYFFDALNNGKDFTKKSNTECLVCGLEREKLEKIYSNIKNGFNIHRIYCHHIMNYINYLFYVQSLSYRDPIIEEGIWKYHLNNNNIYLPIKTCFQMKEEKILEIMNAKKEDDEKE